MWSQSVEVSPMLFSTKHVVTAGSNYYAVIMPLREALTCAGSVVFKQNHFNSAYFLVNIGKQKMNTLQIYESKNILKLI